MTLATRLTEARLNAIADELWEHTVALMQLREAQMGSTQWLAVYDHHMEQISLLKKERKTLYNLTHMEFITKNKEA